MTTTIDPKEMAYRAIARLLPDFPCLHDMEFADAVARLMWFPSEPKDEAQAEEWAFNTLQINLQAKFWGEERKG